MPVFILLRKGLWKVSNKIQRVLSVNGGVIAGFGVALMAWCGCGGELMETRRRVPGPVPEVGWLDPGGGHAKYSLQGAAWIVEGRRKDALEKIAAYCAGAGKYKIVDEVDRDEMEASYSANDVEESVGHGGKHYAATKYRHVYFECAQGKP